MAKTDTHLCQGQEKRHAQQQWVKWRNMHNNIWAWARVKWRNMHNNICAWARVKCCTILPVSLSLPRPLDVYFEGNWPLSPSKIEVCDLDGWVLSLSPSTFFLGLPLFFWDDIFSIARSLQLLLCPYCWHFVHFWACILSQILFISSFLVLILLPSFLFPARLGRPLERPNDVIGCPGLMFYIRDGKQHHLIGSDISTRKQHHLIGSDISTLLVASMYIIFNFKSYCP